MSRKQILRCLLTEQPKHEYKEDNTSIVDPHDEAMKAYINKYGRHFTKALADKAVSMMDNPYWYTTQLSKALEENSWDIHVYSDNITIGDITYLSNIIYTSLYGEVIDKELDCIKSSIAIVNDKNFGECHAFNTWLNYLQYHNIKIEWDKYL